jgi:hypothetical protein
MVGMPVVSTEIEGMSGALIVGTGGPTETEGILGTLILGTDGASIEMDGTPGTLVVGAGGVDIGLLLLGLLMVGSTLAEFPLAEFPPALRCEDAPFKFSFEPLCLVPSAFFEDSWQS